MLSIKVIAKYDGSVAIWSKNIPPAVVISTTLKCFMIVKYWYQLSTGQWYFKSYRLKPIQVHINRPYYNYAIIKVLYGRCLTLVIKHWCHPAPAIQDLLSKLTNLHFLIVCAYSGCWVAPRWWNLSVTTVDELHSSLSFIWYKTCYAKYKISRSPQGHPQWCPAGQFSDIEIA